MSQLEYLDYEGLQLYSSLLAEVYETKDEVDQLVQKKSYAQWLAIGDSVLNAGTILIYTDRTISEGKYIPDLKIADGETTVNNLPFLSKKIANELGFTFAEDGTVYISADIAKKLEHSLTIGTIVFDGTSDVTIPIYNGE